MAKENPGWGYDRIVGAMANLGLRLSDQTVGNILRRHDIPPAPKRKQATSWKDFIRAHMAVLVATDFFTVEVLTLRGLIGTMLVGESGFPVPVQNRSPAFRRPTNCSSRMAIAG